ncbi:MAG TPA: DUF3667 domain-containing protein [Longimicrobium sp.]|jgi:hypothetical protein
MSTISVPLGAASPAESAVSAAPAATACPSCGTALAGAFCHACGEGNPAVEDRSLRRFFREVADELTLDSKVLRTVRLLVTRPGELTLEYLRGRRRPYMSPLRLYLVVFAVTLILASLLEPAPGAQAGNGTSDFLERTMDAVQNALAQARHITPAEAREELTDRTRGLVTWFAVLTPFIFAAFLQLAYVRRKRWFTEQLVFATHFAAFNYVVGILFLPIQYGAVGLGQAAVIPLGLLAFAWVCGYLYLALRRVYDGPRLGTAVRTFFLTMGLSVAQMVTGMLALGAAVVALLYF